MNSTLGSIGKVFLTVEEAAKIADEVGTIAHDGDGELYIARKISACIRRASAVTSTSAPQRPPDRSVQQALSDMIVVYNNISITLANNGVGWNYFRGRDLEQMFAKVKAAKEVLAAVTPADGGGK